MESQRNSLAPSQKPGLELGDLLELGVAIEMHAHRFFLACLMRSQPVLFKQLAQHMVPGRHTYGGQAPTDL